MLVKDKLIDLSIKYIATPLSEHDRKALILSGNLAKACNSYRAINSLVEAKLCDNSLIILRVLFEQMIFVRFLIEKASDKEFSAYLDFDAINKFHRLCNRFGLDIKDILNSSEEEVRVIVEEKNVAKKEKLVRIILDAQALIKKYGQHYKKQWYREGVLSKLIERKDKEEMWYYKNVYTLLSSKVHSDVSSVSEYFVEDSKHQLRLNLTQSALPEWLILNTAAYFFTKLCMIYENYFFKQVSPVLEEIQQELMNEFGKYK